MKGRESIQKSKLRPERGAASNLGFALMEVVMASGLMLIVMLGASSMMMNTQNGATSVQKRIDGVQLQSFIGTVLNNAQSCTTSLNGHALPAVGVSVPTLHYAGLSFDDGANSLFDNGSVKIASLKYLNVVPSGTQYNTVVRMVVNLQGTGTQPVVGGNVLPAMDFPMVVNTTGGVISSCGSGSTGIDRYYTLPTGCWWGGSNLISCGGSATLPTAMADANYQVYCEPITYALSSGKHPVGQVNVTAVTPTQFNFVFVTIMSDGQHSGQDMATMTCHVHHD